MRNISQELIDAMMLKHGTELQRKPTKMEQIYQNLLRLKTETQTKEASQQLTTKISEQLKTSNEYLNQKQQFSSQLEELVLTQQKKMCLSLVFQLNDFVQLQMKREQQLKSDCELESVQTDDLHQRLAVKHIGQNKFQQVVNTLIEISILQKKVAEHVQQQEESIYRTADLIEKADENVEKGNKYLKNAVKNIKGRHKLIVKVFVVIIVWMLLKRLLKKLW